MNTRTKISQLDNYLRSQDLDKSLELIETASNEDLKDIHFLTRANDIFQRLKRHKDALKSAKLLKEIFPQKPVGYARCAQSYLALHEIDSALKVLNEGLIIEPNHATLISTINQAYRENGTHEKALEFSKALIKAHPDKPAGFIRCGQDLIKLQEHNQAINVVEEGLKRHPKNPILLKIGLEAAQLSNKIESSLKFAQALIVSEPEKPIGFIRSAQNLIKLQQHHQALSAVQEGLNHHPDNPSLLRVGIEAAGRSGEIELAIALSKRMIRSRPENPYGYFKTAMNYLKTNHPLNHTRYTRSLEENFPRNIEALRYLRRIYRIIGDRKVALTISSQIIEQTSDQVNEDDQSEYCADLIILGESQKAIEFAQEYSPSKANDIATCLSLMTNKEQLENLDQSSRQLLSQLKLFTHFDDPRFNPSTKILEEDLTNPLLIVIHIGKCAGESILHSLREDLDEKNIRIMEYHLFDANQLLNIAISKLGSHENVYWIICTRDPITRWVSAFNWEVHTYHLKQFYYAPTRVSELFSIYPNAKTLALGLSRKENQATELAGLEHFSFGHLARGHSWYLPKDVANMLPKERTFSIRTEHLQQDYHATLTNIFRYIPQANKQISDIPRTKHSYKNLYPEKTFSDPHDLDDREINAIKETINEDLFMHEYFKTFIH
jgi:predicted Zn-dependent protease